MDKNIEIVNSMKLIKICMLVFCCMLPLKGMKRMMPSVNTLIDAAQKGDCQEIEAYVQMGGDVNAKQQGREFSALMEAMLYGHEEAFKLLLRLGANPNAQDSCGETVLFHDRCSAKMFNGALKAGADPNIQDNKGITPLMDIVRWGGSRSFLPRRIALLLMHGAKIDIADKDGKTVLDYADQYTTRLVMMDKAKQEEIVAETALVFKS